MITFVNTPNQTTNSLAAAYSWLLGYSAEADVKIGGYGEIVGIYIPHYLPKNSASCYVTLTYKDITGTSGTIFSKAGVGAISGTTPVFYPVRDMPCIYDGVVPAGSVNLNGVPYPLWGRDLLLTVGSIGSPAATFSGIELIIKS